MRRIWCCYQSAPLNLTSTSITGKWLAMLKEISLGLAQRR
jgi:hypothetical protein